MNTTKLVKIEKIALVNGLGNKKTFKKRKAKPVVTE